MQKVIPEKRVERCIWYTGPETLFAAIRLQKMRNIKNSNETVTCFPDKKRYTIFDIGLVRLGQVRCIIHRQLFCMCAGALPAGVKHAALFC